MYRIRTFAISLALVALVACSRQAPDTPAATAVVVPASASVRPQIPSSPASDPSVPTASSVASGPGSIPLVAEAQTGAAASSASAPASSASQP